MKTFADVARDILGGRDIVILSDGSANRTFSYVADAVAGYYKILIKGTPGEAYNIGVESPEITVLELARRLAMLGSELFGHSGQIMHGKSGDRNYLVDNPSRRCPIVAKARGELGYAPQVGLDEGLRRSLLWYSGNSEAAEA